MIEKFIVTIIATLSFGYGAADPVLTAPEVQLERLLEWKKVYAPSDVMPGLTAQFEENSKAIRRALPVHLLKEFDCVYHIYSQTGFTLRRFNEAHCDFAFILSKHQKRQGGINYYTQTDEGSCAYIKSETVHAEKLGCYPYTVVSLTGILSVELLNKSFAHKSAFCGFSLKPSTFDGVFNATTLTTLRHDWQHASFVFCL